MTKAPGKLKLALPPLSVRFIPAVRAALQKAASDDARPISSLVQKIVADWLKEGKYLK